VNVWLQRLAARRRFKHTLPYSEVEMELLAQAPIEGRALRRHRSKMRRLLMRGSAS
jgi:hypothetical protein